MDFILKNFGNDIYSVTIEIWMGHLPKGSAIMQSWIIVGSTKVLVVDGGVPEVEGFRKFIEETFDKPAEMFNTHGHIDHIGCNNQFDEVWLNEKDWPLLLGDGMHMDMNESWNENDIKRLPYNLHNIQHNDTILLGDRNLTAIVIPGHTPGSVMLYDKRTESLFSGDSVARRILYGLSGWIPLSEYFKSLDSLQELSIKAIYSMHDSFALPPNQPEKIKRKILSYIETAQEVWKIPGEEQEFLRISIGENETDLEFFDFVMPLKKRQEVLNDLYTHGYF